MPIYYADIYYRRGITGPLSLTLRPAVTGITNILEFFSKFYDLSEIDHVVLTSRDGFYAVLNNAGGVHSELVGELHDSSLAG